ncbi:MAG: hypothetical protein AAB922_06265 [Patescibacteria group bacterium]
MKTPGGLEVTRHTATKKLDDPWEVHVVCKSARAYFEGFGHDIDLNHAFVQAYQDADKEQVWRLSGRT